MKEILLTQGKKATVDDWTYDLLAQFKWQWDKPRWGRGSGYASRIETHNYVRKRIFMHHMILPRKKGFETDHIDGDGLNNQSSNLRYATRLQNSYNRRKRFSSKLPHRGLRLRGNKWSARIYSRGKLYHLGTFINQESAINAYRTAAKKLYGEFVPCDL